jgi:N-hydroxyarylamine O-acetyltransferase
MSPLQRFAALRRARGPAADVRAGLERRIDADVRSTHKEPVVTSLDLGAYLERIGWSGEAPVTLETLSRLIRAHMSSIAFENLDVLLGRPVRLDLDGIQDKLVRGRRGGYCFEHAILFAAAIERLGFKSSCHSARVVLFLPRTETPRTHMFLTVGLPQGRFVVDPGFGGAAAQFAIPLVDGRDESPHEASHWMTKDGPYWWMRTRAGDGSSDVWVSTLEEEYPIDFEMANHYTASHPRSPFVNRLMMSVFRPDGRITMMNRDVTIRRGATTHKSQLTDRTALRNLLIEHFGFDLPDVEQLRVPAIPEWN